VHTTRMQLARWLPHTLCVCVCVCVCVAGTCEAEVSIGGRDWTYPCHQTREQFCYQAVNRVALVPQCCKDPMHRKLNDQLLSINIVDTR